MLNKCHAGVDDQKHEDEDDHRKVILTLPYLGPISIILRRNVLKLVSKFYPHISFRIIFRRGFRISTFFTIKTPSQSRANQW